MKGVPENYAEGLGALKTRVRDLRAAIAADHILSFGESETGYALMQNDARLAQAFALASARRTIDAAATAAAKPEARP